MEVKYTAIEALLFFAAYFIHAVAPFMFYVSWIFLILLGQMVVQKEKISVRRLFFSILVGAPIGVLSAAAVHDYFQTSENISALAGCAVAIMAEHILNGNIIKKVMDAVLSKISGGNV